MNRSSRLSEQRRSALDSYLRSILRFYENDLYSLPHKLVEFLNLARENPSIEIDESQDYILDSSVVSSEQTSTNPVMIFSDKPALDFIFSTFSPNSLDSARPFGRSASPLNHSRKNHEYPSPSRSSLYCGSSDLRSLDTRPFCNIVLEGTLRGLYSSQPILPHL